VNESFGTNDRRGQGRTEPQPHQATSDGLGSPEVECERYEDASALLADPVLGGANTTGSGRLSSEAALAWGSYPSK
jgi:hypothetical protein